VQRRLWSEDKGLSPGPEAWLSRAGSQCLRYWERWLSPARRRVAAHVRSIRHARVDPKLSGSLKSQGFRRQYKGFCQARALFAASHPVSHSASKVVSYSQLGGQGSAHLSSPSFFYYIISFTSNNKSNLHSTDLKNSVAPAKRWAKIRI